MNDGAITNEFEKKMMESIDGFQKNIVYVDGEDIRLAYSLKLFKKYNNSNTILLGNKETITQNLKKAGLNVGSQVEIIEPAQSPYFEEYKGRLLEIFRSKNKHVSEQEAEKMVGCPNYFAAMMLEYGQADCGISGSISSTGAMMKPVIQIIKAKNGRKYLSGAVLQIVPDCPYGQNGQFLFADVAVMPDPDQEQMYDLVLASHDTAKSLFEDEPKIALLSYSTKGSAGGEKVEQIKKVVEKVKENHPEVKIDGELQFDAAVVPEVAKAKCADSEVAGYANVLIFPDLNSANICVKVTQRLARADYYGTIIQGSNIPFNDLSRGSPPEEIAILSFLTLKQLKFKEKKG